MITIIALFDIQSHDSPVVSVRPCTVKRAPRLATSPTMSVNQDTNLQKMKRGRCCGGGAMVESEPVASGVRWPKSNWEIPDYQIMLLEKLGLATNVIPPCHLRRKPDAGE